MRIFTVEEPIFKTATLFVFGCTYEELGRYLKTSFRAEVDSPVDTSGITGQMLTYRRSPYRVVWVQRDTQAALPVIMHEVLHLVTRICQDKGIPIVAHHPDGMNGDEPAAYLIEYFTKAILQRVRV